MSLAQTVTLPLPIFESAASRRKLILKMGSAVRDDRVMEGLQLWVQGTVGKHSDRRLPGTRGPQPGRPRRGGSAVSSFPY